MVHVVDLGFGLVALALLAGGIVQECIGFGMVVVAFPVLVMVDPALMPQTILVVSLPAAWWLSRQSDSACLRRASATTYQPGPAR